jgi:hypothetical protein
MRVEEIKVYIADDGTQFYDKAKCEEYEKNSIHMIEVEANINAVIRLDCVRVKLPIEFSGNPQELSNPEILTSFLDRAWDAFMDTDNYLTAGELLKIAREQGRTPYLDCYEDVDVYDYHILKG